MDIQQISVKVSKELLTSFDEKAKGLGLTRQALLTLGMQAMLGRVVIPESPPAAPESTAHVAATPAGMTVPDCTHARAKVLKLRTCTVCGTRLD